MPSAVVEALLEVAPVFANFTDRDRKDLLEVVVEENYAPGLEIVRFGQPAQSMYVVAEGTVEVIEPSDFDDPSTLATLIPPCSFGEVAFFEKGQHQVAVRTVTAVHVISIDRVGFDRLLARQSLAAHKLAHNVLLKLGDQVTRIEKWVVEQIRQPNGISYEQWNEFRAKLYQGLEV